MEGEAKTLLLGTADVVSRRGGWGAEEGLLNVLRSISFRNETTDLI